MNKETLSPLDNRYYNLIINLCDYFSEFNQTKYQIMIEIKYLNFIINNINEININDDSFLSILSNFNKADFYEIKTIETKIKHDIKSIEYFIKSRIIDELKPWIHFGLTSQDIIHTARILSIKDSHQQVMIPTMNLLIHTLNVFSNKYININMLARTHGQPAINTTVFKEFKVFVHRLQKCNLNNIKFTTKFGGAIGTLQAHYDALPNYDWNILLDKFINQLDLDEREQYTTQVSGGENLNDIFTIYTKINNILIDLCQDIWYYHMLNYIKPNEININQVGSSTMPQKINPIKFENAEGNLQLANCLFNFFSNKVQISRLQRDLTDSTVLRNIGVAFGHTLIAWKSIINGFNNLQINKEKIQQDLNLHPEIILESIQTILRTEGIHNAYELCKNEFKGKQINLLELKEWINSLNVSNPIKQKIQKIFNDKFNLTKEEES